MMMPPADLVSLSTRLTTNAVVKGTELHEKELSGSNG